MQNLPIKATAHPSSSSMTSTGWWEEDEAMEILAWKISCAYPLMHTCMHICVYLCISLYICTGFVHAGTQTGTTAWKQTLEFDSVCDYSDGPWHVVDPGWLALSQTTPRHSSGASMHQSLSPVGKLELAILFRR